MGFDYCKKCGTKLTNHRNKYCDKCDYIEIKPIHIPTKGVKPSWQEQ